MARPAWVARAPKRIKADIDGSGELSFRSKGELAAARDLQKKGASWDYEKDKLEYRVAPRKYILDFTIETASGKTLFIEYKGYTPGWAGGSDRKKIKTVLEAYPLADLRIVWDVNKSGQSFGDKPIRKGSKTTNRQWAEKNNIKQADGFVPQEWLDE